MPSSNGIMVTIDAKDCAIMGRLTPVDGNVTNKDDTVFNMVSADGTFSIMGTWDEIIEFASNIVANAYIWPILSGREDWLGTELVDINTDEVRNGSTSGNSGTAGIEPGHSGAGGQDRQSGGERDS